MLYISAVIIVQIRLDIERVAEPGRRIEPNDRRTHSARPIVVRRALPVSEDNVPQWRSLIEAGGKTNPALSQPDLIAGATALEHGLTIVSRDTSDDEKGRVPVVNRWPGVARL
jgi:toxin FitB